VNNPYLAKLHGIVRADRGQNSETRYLREPSKPSKLGFEGFEGEGESHIFDFETGARGSEHGSGTSEICNKAYPSVTYVPQNFGRIYRFGRCLSELERRCPAHVEQARWQLAIKDGRRFLAEWGEKTESLGWTAGDLFGLHEVPDNPHPTYQRLGRYDCTGLIWLLQGCPVVALTEATAAIKMPTGNITTYRRHNKPAYGPLGDSINDFVA
jgi:hypothetical protein